MSKLTKNRKLALEKLDKDKLYTIGEASELVKEMTKAKYDASVDVDVRLGVDPRKANQMVRGSSRNGKRCQSTCFVYSGERR